MLINYYKSKFFLHSQNYKYPNPFPMTDHSRVQDQDSSQSFFMTNCLHSKPLPPSPSRLIFENSYNVEDWLQNTQRMLEHKRERAVLHSRRLRELEKEFGERQAEMMRSLEWRQESSQRLKNKSIVQVTERLKRISERRTKIGQKVKNQGFQDLEKHLQLRKSYEPDETSILNSNGSRGSRTSVSDERIQLKAIKIRQAEDGIGTKLQDYKLKQKHAKVISKEYKQFKSQRAKSHNSIEVPEVRRRATMVRADQIQAQSQEAMQRIDSLSAVRHNKQKILLQRQDRKKKSISQKLRIIKNNLYDINLKNIAKCEELDTKFEKQVSRNHWRDPRGSIHHKRLLDNLEAIQSSQQIKAERIISKHKEIAERNRVFRERRDFLYKNYQNMTIT